MLVLDSGTGTNKLSQNSVLSSPPTPFSAACVPCVSIAGGAGGVVVMGGVSGLVLVGNEVVLSGCRCWRSVRTVKVVLPVQVYGSSLLA